QLLQEKLQHQNLAFVGQEIDTRYAPALNDRFVRITWRDGVVLYLSGAPKDQSFDPASLPPPVWSPGAESAHQASLLGGRKMLLTCHKLQMPDGATYLVEAGAPLDDVRADLRKWLIFLATMLPVLAAIALGGGYVLVNRALSPVDRIAATAE